MIDPGEMAGLADTLAGASLDACNARDWLVSAWKLEWAAPDLLKDAYVQFCKTWIAGTDSTGQYVDFLAQYTQAIANAYCAVDQKLAESYNSLHDKSEMPEGYYDPPKTSGGYSGPVA